MGDVVCIVVFVFVLVVVVWVVYNLLLRLVSFSHRLQRSGLLLQNIIVVSLVGCFSQFNFWELPHRVCVYVCLCMTV